MKSSPFEEDVEAALGVALVEDHGFAEYNPVSAMAAAVRTLFGNPTALPSGAPWPLQHRVLASLGWCVAMLAVAIPLTVWRFRAHTSS
jgi:hypothetical protein